ncbi:MAG: TatD family hydrolase [Candidatus Bathyarchaeia archaeon]
MRFVDAHIHLSDPEYEANVDKVVEDSQRSKVVALLSNSTNYQTSLMNIKLADKYSGLVYAALGIHPWNVRELLPNEVEQTMNLAVNHKHHEKIVAVGEIGLDNKYAKRKKKKALLELQYEVFCRMLQLGEKLSLPVIIHSRETASEIIDILASYQIKKVLLHWFSGPIELLPKIVDLGYHVTEGPAIFHSTHIQDIVRKIPLTYLLTETDGPVRFSRAPIKGEITTPKFIPLIVDKIAKTRNENKTEVAEQLLLNFETFFEIKVQTQSRS